MLYTEGTLVVEDRTLRKIARSNVNTALRSLETKTARIVDALVNKLTSQTENFGTVDRLLELVLAHPQLATETITIKRYVDAFPELKETVTINRSRIENRIRTRLERALAPFDFHRRFRFTRVRHCH
jgi:hypothetical protein